MIYLLLFKKHLKVRNKILNFQQLKNVIPAKEMDQNLDTRLIDAHIAVEMEK